MTLMNFWNVLLGHKTSERGGMAREGRGKKRSRGKERGMRKVEEGGGVGGREGGRGGRGCVI